MPQKSKPILSNQSLDESPSRKIPFVATRGVWKTHGIKAENGRIWSGQSRCLLISLNLAGGTFFQWFRNHPTSWVATNVQDLFTLQKTFPGKEIGFEGNERHCWVCGCVAHIYMLAMNPIGSMFGISCLSTCSYHQNQQNVGKHTSPMGPMGSFLVPLHHLEVLSSFTSKCLPSSLLILFSSCLSRAQPPL